jgi:hypothetical protein
MLKRIIRAVRNAISNRDDLMDLTDAVFYKEIKK